MVTVILMLLLQMYVYVDVDLLRQIFQNSLYSLFSFHLRNAVLLLDSTIKFGNNTDHTKPSFSHATSLSQGGYFSLYGNFFRGAGRYLV